MMNHERKCSLLPEEIGENIIQINLDHDTNLGEVARKILFVTPGGFLPAYSYAPDKNPVAATYINLVDIAKNGIRHMKQVPEIIGSNSPTGKTEFSLKKSNQPQVYLVLEKSPAAKNWRGFEEDFAGYLHQLHFGCSLTDNDSIMNIISNGSRERQEFLVINFEKNQVNYLGDSRDNQHNLHESVSLAALTNVNLETGLGKN